MGEILTLPVQNSFGYLQATGTEVFYAGMVPHPEALAPAVAFCINADHMLGLGSVRRQARAEAERVLAENRQHLHDGNFEFVPLDVDALGTAAKVAAIAGKYGKTSEQYNEARMGLLKDCSRKWAEAFRKNAWEYFDPNMQRYDELTDQLIADGLSVDEMVRNGLSPVAEAEETRRRANDYVRLTTNKELIKRPDADELATVHISPCAEWAHRSLRENPKSAHGGYAPEIDKLMIDYDWFESSTKTVYHEQLAVSGKYVTPAVINEVYASLNLTGDVLDRTGIHDTVGVVARTGITGVVDMQKMLDEVAGEHSGKNIFLGEEVSATHEKDYAGIYAEAQRRRKEQAHLSEQLAVYVESLHANGTDPMLATVLVEKYIQEKLLKIAAKNPDQAEIIFDKATADGFREVQSLRAAGEFQKAAELQQSVEIAAPQASSCGAGSCGLEAIKPGSQEAEDAKRLGFDPKATIADKGGRTCKACGSKNIMYDTKKKQKGCGNCSAKKGY